MTTLAPMVKIQTNLAVSVPVQLRSILSEEIDQGRFGESGKIPSERALAERFGISRTSVRESLNYLVKDGVLVRIVGKGTYVASLVGNLSTQSHEPGGHLAFLIGENIFQFVQPGYSRVLVGAEQTCRQRGYRLLFHSVGEEEAEPCSGLRLGLPQTQPDGIQGCLVAGGVRKKTLDYLMDWDVPIVLTDLIVQDGNTSAVGPDYSIGTRQAIEHLASLGHRDIGFIGFPNSAKYQTFWATLESLDLRYKPHFVQFLHLPDVEPGLLAGFRAMQDLLRSSTLPSAIITTNDMVAIGAIEALKMAGISVPAGMSVIGCDDLGRDMNPPLTTIRSYPEEVGRIAARMLIDRLAGNTAATRIAVPTELVVRASTARLNVPEQETRIDT